MTDPSIATHDAGAAPEPAPNGAAGGPGGWRDGIADPGLRRAAERFASPEEAVRSWSEAQKKISRSVTLPGRDAEEGERRAFARKHLGVPETADGYKLTPPEALTADPDGQARFDRFLAAAHGALATPEQVEALAGWYAEEAATAAADAGRSREAREAQAVQGLRRQWGRDYDANLAYARRAADHLFGAEAGRLAELPLADGSRLGGLPEVVTALAALGRGLGEAEFGGGTGAAPGSEGVQAELDRLIEESRAAGTYFTEPVQARVRALYERLVGTGPALENFGRGPDA